MTPAGVLGAVLAGGRSTRYGSAKALATVGGRRIVDRAIAALRAVTDELVLIANDPELAGAVDLPWRSDAVTDLGALGGIHAGLLWARERERRGILVVACDMPFVRPALLVRILELSAAQPSADVVIPESRSRRGVEPLCAYYGVRCIAAIEAAVSAGDRRMIGFHAYVAVARIPLVEVETIGAPAELFLNVNTPEDRELAERLERERRV